MRDHALGNRLFMKGWGPLGLCLLLWGAAPPDAPVADAAMRDDVEQVRALIADGADVNAAQGDGMSALHWAAENGSVGMTRILLEAGANVEAVTRLGAYRPLHLAAKGGHQLVVESLLQASAEPGAGTNTGSVTPLHFAVASGSAGAVQALIEHGADVDVRESVWGQTPLMFAAASGRTATVEALLGAGADDGVTATVLDMPTRDQADRDDQAARRERTAPAERGGGGEPRAGRGGGGQTPYAGGRSPTEQELLLVQQRDRVDQPLSHADLIGGYGGLSALLLAVREGHTETAFLMLDHGADIDQVSAGDHTSPLLMALINGHFDLAMRLFERGADPTVASDAGATPLYVTLNTEWIPKSRHPQPTDRLQQEVTYLELMRAFLDAGVDPNLRLTKPLWYTTFGDDYLRTTRLGATPFWRAAYGLDIEAMKLLIAYGADPSIPTMKPAARSFRGGRGGGERSSGPDPSGLPPVPTGGPGSWPIHAASGIGYGEGYAANIHRHVPDAWVPAVRYLVDELGADVDARDHNGYTALHHAAARGDSELVLFLIARGADVSVVSRRGQTTADMANGPVQRILPFYSTMALLEGLGSHNNHNCVGC